MLYVMKDDKNNIMVESFNNEINTTGYGNTLTEALHNMRVEVPYSTIASAESEEELRANYPELFI